MQMADNLFSDDYGVIEEIVRCREHRA